MKALKINGAIKTLDKSEKVFCHDSYAQEFYDMLKHSPVIKKDVQNGQTVRVLDVLLDHNGEMFVNTSIGVPISVDIRKDKKFFISVGFKESDICTETIKELINALWFRDFFQNNPCNIAVENKGGVLRGSLYSSFLNSKKQEFLNQITEKSAYYMGKIISKNQGGFFIKVQGIDAFLPGSLAAANKIVDFESYIGKEIPLMVEDYLPQNDTFIFSFKKYLEKILPIKMDEIKRHSSVSGIVTGCSKYGVFVEVDELFTGLLHTSEMNEKTYEQFQKGMIHQGNTMKVWVKDIKNEKLILTEFDPLLIVKQNETLKERLEGVTIKGASVVSVKPYGVLLDIGDNILGLLPVNEAKKLGRKMHQGENLDVLITRVDSETGKVYLNCANRNMVYRTL